VNTTDHLSLIESHLKKLLAIAEKRTQGKWSHRKTGYAIHGFDNGFICKTEYGDGDAAKHRQENAAFIAACAGNAEAGWKSTLAVIETAKEMKSWDGSIHQMYIRPDAEEIINAVLAAYPIELLQ
jgi:hypothetical protein